MAEMRPRAEEARRWVCTELAPERAARLVVAKMTGIIRYVAPLPKPLAVKSSRNRTRKSQKFFSGRVQIMVRVITAMAAKAVTVIRAPPHAVRHASAVGAGQGADQRAEEGQRQCHGPDADRGELREVVLDELGEDTGEADERAEGADVQQRHDPQVRFLQRGERTGHIALGAGEVVHVLVGAERRHQDERNPHQSGHAAG